MTYIILFAICAVITLVITVCITTFIMPQKLDGTFRSGVFQWMHDYFNVKKTYLMNITKYIFVFITVASIVLGVLMLISDLLNGYVYAWYVGPYRISVFRFRGLMLLILGPVISRLIQECITVSMRVNVKTELLCAKVIDLEENVKSTTTPIHKQNSLYK